MAQDTTQYCIVIKSASGPIALVRKDGRLQLPVVVLPDSAWPPDESAEINGQLMDEHGLNCTLLCWLEKQQDSNLILLEWHPGSAVPEVGVEWVDPFSDGIPLTPEHVPMVRRWLESSPDGLAPWEKPSWMQEVVIWLMGVFNGVDHPQLTNLAQIKAGWGMSTVLLIETTGADYYFKASNRQGIDEWRLTKVLHDRFPDRVPNPIRVDEQRGWMITRAIEHTPLAPMDYHGLGETFRTYADIQLGCGDLIETGGAPGLRVRDANWLENNLDGFFCDHQGHEEYESIKSNLDTSQLAKLKKTWLQHIEALKMSTIPMGLVQEDLHFDNILNTTNGPVIIDWADCAMAHPLFSYHRILRLWGRELSDTDRLERAHVTQAYLDAFSHLAEDKQLHHEVELIRPLYRLYNAFHWQELALERGGRANWGVRCSENVMAFMQAAIDEVGLPG